MARIYTVNIITDQLSPQKLFKWLDKSYEEAQTRGSYFNSKSDHQENEDFFFFDNC